MCPEVTPVDELSKRGFGADFGVGGAGERVVKKILVFSTNLPVLCGNSVVEVDSRNRGEGGDNNPLDSSCCAYGLGFPLSTKPLCPVCGGGDDGNVTGEEP